MLLSSSAVPLFQINSFEYYQSVKIKNDVMSVLIWVQIFCEGKQQTIKVAASKEPVKSNFPDNFITVATCRIGF